MAANQHCENCGAKGRTNDGLCHDCWMDEMHDPFLMEGAQ